MKKGITLLSFLMIANLSFSQLDGHWNGTLEIQGAKLKIVFHIQKAENKN